MYPIFSLNSSPSVAMECPATHASPDVGSMMAVRSLMVVVLPAPSGPTRPNNSPLLISRFRLSTAMFPPKDLVRFVVFIAPKEVSSCLLSPVSCLLSPVSCLLTHDPLFQKYLHIRRHARFELIIDVLHAHLNPIDKFHALFLRLDVLRREFRLGRYIGDRALVYLPRIGIRSDLGLLTELHQPELAFFHVHLDPRVFKVADRIHRRPGRYCLPCLNILPEHHPAYR